MAPTISQAKLRLLFALLFSSPEPVTLDRVREVLRGGENSEDEDERFGPKDYLEALEAWMLERELPLELHKVGKAWRLLTSEDVADDLETVRKQVHNERLGPAALEVLSLVAYRQPVLKADVDAIRGVQSGPHLRHLLDLRLIRILGRANLPGRPFLYGTTREFLDKFGLRDLQELPEAGRLATPAETVAMEPGSDAEASASADSSPAGRDAAGASTDGPPAAGAPVAAPGEE